MSEENESTFDSEESNVEDSNLENESSAHASKGEKNADLAVAGNSITNTLKDNGKNALKSAADSALEGTKAGEAIEQAERAAETVAKAQKFAGGVKAGFAKISPILVNPIFWIIVGILALVTFIIMSIITATQTFGSIETDCRPDGSVAVAMPNSDASVEEKKNAMATWLMANQFESLGGKPMTRAQASAVVGNFAAESSLGFDVTEGHVMNGASNEEVDAWTRGGARGLGLAQWTHNPGRAGNLIELARSNGGNWYDVDVQLEMIRQEIDGSYGPRLVEAGFNEQGKSAGDLSIIFHDIYEVSADSPEKKERRAQTADDFMKTFSGGGYDSGTNNTCQTVGTVAADCSPVLDHAAYCYPVRPSGFSLNTYGGHPAEASDLPMPEGTELFAFGSGVVISETITVGSWCPVGRAGTIQHEVEIQLDKPINGASTVRYSHMREASPLSSGTHVDAGTFIGYSGNTGCSTGAHLHFEFERGTGVNLTQFVDGSTL